MGIIVYMQDSTDEVLRVISKVGVPERAVLYIYTKDVMKRENQDSTEHIIIKE